MVDFENSSSAAMAVSANECSSGGNNTQSQAEMQPMKKKKRNLPGMPGTVFCYFAIICEVILIQNRIRFSQIQKLM